MDKFFLEEKMLKALKDYQTFPSLFFSSLKESVIIESLYGPNLKKLFEFCGNKFPIQTICFIGIEIVSRLKDFHSQGFIHRDIKPSNLVWGNLSESSNELKDQIMLIDYDLAGIFLDKNKSHINFQYDDLIVGNLLFKSINSNNYISQTRRDDLESLLYCLIYFYKGELPWNKKNVNEVYNKINRKYKRLDKNNKNGNSNYINKSEIYYEFKVRIPPKKLCEDLPKEFEVLLYYIRNLSFDETPNYELIKDLLKRIIIKNFPNSEEGEYRFIWEKKLNDILSLSKTRKCEELLKAKNQLFKGFCLDMERFIKNLKKNNIFINIIINKIFKRETYIFI